MCLFLSVCLSVCFSLFLSLSLSLSLSFSLPLPLSLSLSLSLFLSLSIYLIIHLSFSLNILTFSCFKMKESGNIEYGKKELNGRKQIVTQETKIIGRDAKLRHEDKVFKHMIHLYWDRLMWNF